MREVIQSGVVLEYDELRMLLQSQGVKTFLCFTMDEKQLSDAEVILNIHSLVEKELITYSCLKNGFVPCGLLQEFLRIVKKTEKTLVIQRKMREYPVVFIYQFRDKCAMVESLLCKKNALKISIQNSKKLFQLLQISGYLPGKNQILTSAEAVLADEMIRSGLTDLSEVFHISIYDADQETVSKDIVLYEKGIYWYMQTEGENLDRFESLTEEAMKSIRDELEVGESYDIGGY